MAKAKSLIRKYKTAWLLTVCCILLFIIPHKAQAALTKTTSFDTIDAWQALAAGTLADGNAEDISASYATLVYIEVALTDTDAQAGVDVSVEISYADDDWMTFWGPVGGTAETPVTTDVNDASSAAGDAYMILVDSATGDFDVPGRKWFVVDGTVANSESFKTKSNANPDTVTLCQDTMRDHANSLACWDRVDEWVVAIPFGAAYVRVIINNTDADADIHWRSYCSKVSAL